MPIKFPDEELEEDELELLDDDELELLDEEEDEELELLVLDVVELLELDEEDDELLVVPVQPDMIATANSDAAPSATPRGKIEFTKMPIIITCIKSRLL
ncbi:MAG: hypothetical protein RL497_1926 [Pseudomonadota bacterium]